MKIKASLIVLCCLCLFPVWVHGSRPSHSHEVYFEGTNYELHIFRINGRVEGKTMLIVGGIQGDEPGGFLSADLYSDLALEKGNLIVVPRANLQSVILFNRGVEGDMNRLFNDEEPKDLQGMVVHKLKELINEADIFLNLHDGWGFHNPEYIDRSRNPNRFGQSVIVDEEVFQCSDNSALPLGKMARDVLEAVNSKIEDPDLKLHFFNTKTGEKDTKFKDMRKTATWYALTNRCIPAFGIEGSKNVKSIEQNVLYHNYAVNEFMRLMDIIPEQPRVMIIKAEMETAYINVNGRAFEVKSGATLNIRPGDTVEVTYVESNYTRGVTSDILGYGTLNDLGKPFKIRGDTKIVFRKDNQKMSEINIKAERISADRLESVWVFLMKADGKYIAAAEGETVKLPEGTVIEFIKLFSDSVSDGEKPINLKGWVPKNASKNTGDDRGYKITLLKEEFMKKYAADGEASVYPVIAGGDEEPAARIFIEIE